MAAERASRAELTVVLKGDISPATLGIDELARVLEATAAALEALEHESGEKRLLPALKAIRKGSAAAVLVSPDERWPKLARRFYSSARTGCRKNGFEVREAFARLTTIVSDRKRELKVSARGLPGGRALPERKVLPPAEVEGVEWNTVTHGRVVGMTIGSRKKGWGRIELEVDGRRLGFGATEELIDAAAKLFKRTVRSSVVAVRVGDEDGERVLTSLQEWNHPDDTVGEFKRLREQLARSGVSVDLDRLLRDLDED